MLIINDMPEIQAPMPEREPTKSELLNLLIQQQQAMNALPAVLRPCAVLEFAQLITALRFHYRVTETELRYAIEVNS